MLENYKDDNTMKQKRLQQMEITKKWEELPLDCLVEVIGRVGLESLLVDIPFVCKSWYKATLAPSCWQQLDFPGIWRFSLDNFIDQFKSRYRLRGVIHSAQFLKFVIDRSAGCATMVKLPFYFNETLITYVADKCPALKKLVIHSKQECTMLAVSSVIGKFKNLESLELPSGFLIKEIVAEIGAHCEDFAALSLFAAQESKAYVLEEDAMAIATCLPKLKSLTMRGVFVEWESLVKILKGCIELVHFDVRACRGFHDDKVLWDLAPHITTFKSSCSFAFMIKYYSGLEALLEYV